MNLSRVALVGELTARRRVVVGLFGLLAIVTVGFLAGVEAITSFGGLGLGLAVFLVAVGLAGYAGWSRGGALTGITVVSLTLTWMAFFPPFVGYLRGEQWAGTRYSTLRVSDVLLTPLGEVETAVQLLPFYVVSAVFSAGCAFLMGVGARTLYEK